MEQYETISGSGCELTNEHSAKQVNASDTYEVKHEYLGFTITARIGALDSSFAVRDANGDHLDTKDTQKAAITYINNRLEREEKKAAKPRKKLDLKVVVLSNYGHYSKATVQTLTSVHGGTGQVIINGEQNNGKFFPDTPAVQNLVKLLADLEKREGELTDRINKAMLGGRRAGYGARQMDVEQTTEALVKEYNEKAGLSLK